MLDSNLLDEVINHLDENNERMIKAHETALRLTIAKICFANHDLDKTITQLNHLLNQPRNDLQKDVQSVARLLLLIAHYEAGHTRLLPYLYRQTYKMFVKIGGPNEIEVVALDFFKKVPPLTSEQALLKALQLVKVKLQPLKQDEAYQHLIEAFDIVDWIDKKLEG